MEDIKRCFVIGPMKDMSRLNRLANDIIKPILEPEGFRIITPDQGHIGSIMDQVLLNLEQADILVADITGNNPNVMYELGVYHSFGKPSIVIKDRSLAPVDELTPFDIGAYRYLDLDLNNIEESTKLIQPKLAEILKSIPEIDWFPNPVTAFYDSPVAEIPTAVGLSKNYIKNFLDLMWPELFQIHEEFEVFKHSVSVETPEKIMQKLNHEERENLRFEILIPAELNMAGHKYIDDIKSKKTWKYRKAEVVRRTRPFTMMARTDENGHCVLADIPSVLSTLYDSIQNRRGIKSLQVNKEEWEILEGQELERFAAKCEKFRQKIENDYPSAKGKINIVWRWKPEE
jgi:hypothetical protein